MRPTEFICTQCGRKYPGDAPNFRCQVCDEPLELPEIRSGTIKTKAQPWESVFARYSDFFPFDRSFPELFLGEGFTPLLESEKLAKSAGVRKLLVKNETTNPSWSFKDRGTAAALRHAVELGYRKVGTLSSGNMAASVAAFGARAGLEVYILVGETTPQEKIAPVTMYGAHVIQVQGDYGDVYASSLALGEKYGIYFANSDAPFRIEGSKTIAYEICEQSKFDAPDYVIVPTSSGGNLRGIEKGFREFYAAELIDKKPILIAAQDRGICPIHKAFSEKRDRVEHFSDGVFLDNAIANPLPPSGNRVLKVLRETGGWTAALDQEEMLEAQRDLAREGVFVQPGAAVSYAAAKKLRKDGFFTGMENVACVVTGSGLKYLSVLNRQPLKSHDVKLEDLDALFGDLNGVR